MKNIFQLQSNLFKSLANPKRLQILHLLQHEPLTVNEIVKMSGVAQATVSQHLMVLRKLKLVSASRHGHERQYSIASPAVLTACSVVKDFLLSHLGVDGEAQVNRLHLHKDPICGMVIAAKDAASSLTVDKKRFYFCALGCEKKFRKNQKLSGVKEAIISL